MRLSVALLELASAATRPFCTDGLRPAGALATSVSLLVRRDLQVFSSFATPTPRTLAGGARVCARSFAWQPLWTSSLFSLHLTASAFTTRSQMPHRAPRAAKVSASAKGAGEDVPVTAKLEELESATSILWPQVRGHSQKEHTRTPSHKQTHKLHTSVCVCVCNSRHQHVRKSMAGCMLAPGEANLIYTCHYLLTHHHTITTTIK